MVITHPIKKIKDYPFSVSQRLESFESMEMQNTLIEFYADFFIVCMLQTLYRG